jgi:hypothetical protein
MGGKKKKADLCCEFAFVNSTIHTICKKKTKIISAFEQNGSRIKRFQEPVRSGFGMALLKWFKQERSEGSSSYDNFCSSYSQILIVSHCVFSVNLYGNLQLQKSNFNF